MNLELQKSLALLCIIFIFSCLYVSSYFDIGGSRRSNPKLFGLLIFCCLLSFLQTAKLKKWNEQERADYYFVYKAYLYFTLVLMLYVVYIIISRSEYQCMITLNNNINNVCTLAISKIKHRGGSMDYNSYNDGNYDTGNYQGEKYSNVNLMADNVKKGVQIYKQIWRKLLFFI